MIRRTLAMTCLAFMPLVSLAPSLRAADHRDAPGVDGAGEGDITDVFAFLDPGNPAGWFWPWASTPSLFPVRLPPTDFLTEYLYQFKIDRSGTYNEDLVFQFSSKHVDRPTGFR